MIGGFLATPLDDAEGSAEAILPPVVVRESGEKEKREGKRVKFDVLTSAEFFPLLPIAISSLSYLPRR